MGGQSQKKSMRGGKVVQSPPQQCCKAEEKGRATTALCWTIPGTCTARLHFTQPGFGIRGCNNVEEKRVQKVIIL